jgi:hypothetical protein
MSKFKLEFTLKQHTPIIHFQSDQAGATLRATELKPKFDRFLLEQVKDIPFVKNANGSKSLDYKVKISTTGRAEKNLPNSFMFFANNVIKEDKDKKYMLKNSSIKVEFFSFNSDVLEAIKKHFEAFMLISNFGARSTKGYGSFVKEIANYEEILKKYYPIVFKISNPNMNDWETVVDTLHKKLKAGINFRAYHKSLLFQYMCSKNIRWEKRKIKQEFPQVAKSKDGHAPIDCNPKFDFRYVRAMLGLAGINEYQGKQLVTITHKQKEIDRFASPIIYKVIENNIYLLCDRSYEEIMDETFEFALKGKKFEIKTPSKSEFDLYEFLKFVEKQEKLISEVN